MEGDTVDIILKWDHPRTIPAKFCFIRFKGFREEDLNVIFYQNNGILYPFIEKWPPCMVNWTPMVFWPPTYDILTPPIHGI
jgi:hypothetical protein